MKKILAFALSVIMSASFMTACGDDDTSSSKASKNESSSTAAADSSEAVADSADSGSEDASSENTSSEDASSNDGGESKEIGELTKAFNDKIKSNVYSIELRSNMPDLGLGDEVPTETTTIVKRNGDDFYAKVNFFGMDLEVTKIGSQVYTVVPSEKAYSVASDLPVDLAQIDSYSLNEKAVYQGTETEGEFTVETYNVPIDMELGEGVTYEGETETPTKYYYDKDGVLKKIVTDSSAIGKVTVEVVSLDFENISIEEPDTTGLTKVEPDEVSEEVESEAE